jgi:hypothetical protein
MNQYNALITEKLQLISDIQELRLKIDTAKRANGENSEYKLQLKELLLKLEYINLQIQSLHGATG